MSVSVRTPAIFLSVCLLFLAGPASAEMVTLVCDAGDYGTSTVDIDAARHFASISDRFGRNLCAKDGAQIGPRYVTICRGSVVLDRRTSIITWADHSQGQRHRATKDILSD